jgi:transcriptional regulator with XRE-family HTH domain
MKFHEILGQVLYQHGIKASSLSNLIGLTPNALDLVFKRQSEPNWETIRRICHELNISPDVFHDLGAPVELPPLPVSRRPNGPAPGTLRERTRS